VASGAGCVTEGNSTYDSVNNFYIDTGATRSAVLRYNYYSNIGYGINQNFPPDTAFETPPRIADDAPAPAPLPLTHVGTLATFRAKAPHGLFVGEAVKIANARISGQLADTTYNGNFLVETVDPSDAKVFSYRMNMAPSLDADRPTGAQPIQFAARWQTHRWAIENNIFDVYATDINSAAAPRGMSTYGYEGVPPYMFRHLVFRENIVRHLDSVPSTPSAVEGATVGLRIDSVDGALIQENIIDVEDPNPIQYLHSQNVKSFNNATAAGVLIRGHLSTSPETNQKDDDWATVIEDAMVLSL